MQDAQPPAIVQPAPAAPDAEAFVVVRRDVWNAIVLSADTPLPLVKAGRTEDAVLRQMVLLASTLTVVRSTTAPEVETLRWSFEPYVQHQVCFTSMTGLFACTVGESVALPERHTGEAPAAPAPADGHAPPPNPAAEAARTAVTESLRGRADALFLQERRLKIDPVLRAAGVSVRAGAGVGTARR